MPRNLEIKLRAPRGRDLERILRDQLGAHHGGVEEQHDVFFGCARGRLKLRLAPDRPAQLIHYQRSDTAGVRASDYRMAEVKDAERLLAVLEAAAGRLGEVRKRRRIFHLENVRVHLDEVEGLGSFVEIEAVLDATHDEAACRQAVATLLARLGLGPEAAEGRAYVDLLAGHPGSARLDM